MSNNPLVLTFQGLLDILGALITYYFSGLQIGLYSNEVDPDIALTISQIQPTTFSGYTGLQPFAVWSGPAIVGVRATTLCGINTWTHDGGPVADWVAGYYVVNGAGQLVWLAKGEAIPVLMQSAGQQYQVTPEFAQRTEKLL